MPSKTNWAIAVKPLIKKYKGKKHALNYENNYQLLVMVLLSARSSDVYINKIAPPLFQKYPDLKALSTETPAKVSPLIKGVPGWRKKMDWMITIAKELKKTNEVPLTMEELVELPGIGRKSANVILREAGKQVEGIIVDLHVVRVAQRLGISSSSDPAKIEEEIMAVVPQKDWSEVGMAVSILGREICRPTNPEHEACPMTSVCEFYLKGGEKGRTAKKKSK